MPEFSRHHSQAGENRMASKRAEATPLPERADTPSFADRQGGRHEKRYGVERAAANVSVVAPTPSLRRGIDTLHRRKHYGMTNA